MAQYDAYDNPNAAQRAAFPYFVVLQSDQLSQFSTRLAMPLSRAVVPKGVLPRRLSESLDVGGERLFLAPQLCAALPDKLLRRPVMSLKAHASVFADALDAVISGV